MSTRQIPPAAGSKVPTEMVDTPARESPRYLPRYPPRKRSMRSMFKPHKP